MSSTMQFRLRNLVRINFWLILKMFSFFDESGMHRLFDHLMMLSLWRSMMLCSLLLLNIVFLLLSTVIMLLCSDMTI